MKFTKMHGAGNDFVVLDCLAAPFDLNPSQIRKIADRHRGVGCDQMLVVEKPSRPDADFRYRIFNADGGEVEQCGNGARCFVRFVHDRGLTDKREIRVETLGGLIVPKLEDDGEVTVNMGPPVLEGEERIEGVELTILSMGNPHAVQIVEDVDHAPVATQGPVLEHHPRFPNRVNAGYLQIQGRNNARLRVWERGAGETLSCGTGACAAVVAGIRRGLLDSPVRVQTRGGALTIAWAGGDNAVWMKGPAQSVFDGEIEV
jgi:diaminopimelate epimerase